MYYFEDKFEAKGDYFRRFSLINQDTKGNTQTLVEKYLTNNVSMSATDWGSYSFWKQRTIDYIDPKYNHGVFYYNWLNAYLNSITHIVWCAEYYHAKSQGLDEKKSSKHADNCMNTFVKWCKENFQ